MEQNSNMSQVVITTINTILGDLFKSIDNNLFNILDDLTFINSDILQDKYFGKIFGTSASNGILLIANSLLIGFILYYSVKYLSSNFTYLKIENPIQFIFKLIIFGIAMNSSIFIIGQVLDINFENPKQKEIPKTHKHKHKYQVKKVPVPVTKYVAVPVGPPMLIPVITTKHVPVYPQTQQAMYPPPQYGPYNYNYQVPQYNYANPVQAIPPGYSPYGYF